MHSRFLVGGFTPDHSLLQDVKRVLDSETYLIYATQQVGSFLQWIERNQHRIDCLLLQYSDELQDLINQLKTQKIILPMLLIDMDPAANEENVGVDISNTPSSCQTLAGSYHQEVICVMQSETAQLDNFIQQAITRFLGLQCDLSQTLPAQSEAKEDEHQIHLSLQQQRLADKLRERLGYLGIYYKRDPQQFARHLEPAQREELLADLKRNYRFLILNYFKDSSSVNNAIDNLVNMAFFADISVSKIVEIHMDLMDTFAKQLKLEGRSEEILLDYRLTLIDVIAHLCEMYRRSIPRERPESNSK
ncbi:MAG: circadian clock protein KaiA [Leptolyngbyaceae cyanobacterium]